MKPSWWLCRNVGSRDQKQNKRELSSKREWQPTPSSVVPGAFFESLEAFQKRPTLSVTQGCHKIMTKKISVAGSATKNEDNNCFPWENGLLHLVSHVCKSDSMHARTEREFNRNKLLWLRVRTSMNTLHHAGRQTSRNFQFGIFPHQDNMACQIQLRLFPFSRNRISNHIKSCFRFEQLALPFTNSSKYVGCQSQLESFKTNKKQNERKKMPEQNGKASSVNISSSQTFSF